MGGIIQGGAYLKKNFKNLWEKIFFGQICPKSLNIDIITMKIIFGQPKSELYTEKLICKHTCKSATL